MMYDVTIIIQRKDEPWSQDRYAVHFPIPGDLWERRGNIKLMNRIGWMVLNNFAKVYKEASRHG